MTSLLCSQFGLQQVPIAIKLVAGLHCNLVCSMFAKQLGCSDQQVCIAIRFALQLGLQQVRIAIRFAAAISRFALPLGLQQVGISGFTLQFGFSRLAISSSNPS